MTALLLLSLLTSPPALPAWPSACEWREAAVEWGLARDPLRDLDSFPTEEAADGVLRWLTGRRLWLEAQVGLHGDDAWWAAQYAPAARDAKDGYDAWYALDYAQAWRRRAGYYPPNSSAAALYRRYARDDLAELRRLIGDDAYRLGLLPPPIDPRYTAPVP